MTKMHYRIPQELFCVNGVARKVCQTSERYVKTDDRTLVTCKACLVSLRDEPMLQEVN